MVFREPPAVTTFENCHQVCPFPSRSQRPGAAIIPCFLSIRALRLSQIESSGVRRAVELQSVLLSLFYPAIDRASLDVRHLAIVEPLKTLSALYLRAHYLGLPGYRRGG